MSVLILMIIASVTVAGCFLGAFIWCVRDGQYEDQQGAAMRMLQEEDPPLFP